MARPQPMLVHGDVSGGDPILPAASISLSSNFDSIPGSSDDRGNLSQPSSLPDIASSRGLATETDGISERPRLQGHPSKPVGIVRPTRPRPSVRHTTQVLRSPVAAAGVNALLSTSQGTHPSRAAQRDNSTSGYVVLPYFRNALGSSVRTPNDASPATSWSSGDGRAEAGRAAAVGPAMNTFFRLNRKCSELGRKNDALELKLAAYRRLLLNKDKLKSLMHRLDANIAEASQTSRGEEGITSCPVTNTHDEVEDVCSSGDSECV